MEYKQHPLSAAFPKMGDEEFKDLILSVEVIGVQNPITIYEGMVIDGWHRYQASQSLGMDCPSVELEGWIDPREFVLAQNKTRRHITQAQLAMATTAVYAWASEGKPKLHTGCAVKTASEMADIAGVHRNTIVQAQAVQTKAAPEVVAAVNRGEIGLRKAAAIAKLPQAEQAEAINKPLPKPEKTEEVAEEPDYSEIDAAMDQIGDLQAELVVARMGDVPEEQKDQAANLIAELRTEIKTLNAHLAAVILSRDTLQEENTQLKKQCKMYRNKLDKLNG